MTKAYAAPGSIITSLRISTNIKVWMHVSRRSATGAFFAASTRGGQNYADVRYQADDVFLFGPETRGLPQSVLESFPADQRIRIPMRPENRSLNLANAAAVVIYEAWRQLGFAGGS